MGILLRLALRAGVPHMLLTEQSKSQLPAPACELGRSSAIDGPNFLLLWRICFRLFMCVPEGCHSRLADLSSLRLFINELNMALIDASAFHVLLQFPFKPLAMSAYGQRRKRCT